MTTLRRQTCRFALIVFGTLFAGLSGPWPARAEVERLHAWGLAVDAEGVVYAADGRVEPGCVWRLEPQVFEETRGTPTAPVEAAPGLSVLFEAPGIRDLQLDPDGSLWVAASRVVTSETAPGDSVSRREHALFRVGTRVRSADGTVEAKIHVPWTAVDSLFSGAPFRVDERGGVYFPWSGRLRYRSNEGVVSTFLGSAFQGERDGGEGFARFNDVRSMSWTANGDLILVDIAKVRAVSIAERSAETFASALIERGSARGKPSPENDPRYDNRVYGLAPDGDGDRVFLAYHGGRKLLSARRSGRTGTYYTPRDSGWGPVGVARTEEAVYVLEVHGKVTRDLRITRIDGAGETQALLPRREGHDSTE